MNRNCVSTKCEDSPAFNYLKLTVWDNLSPNKSILVKKKLKHYRKSEILLFTMLKTLKSHLYMKPNPAKNQQWIRSWTSVIEYTKKQYTTLGGCVSQSRRTRLTNLPTFRFESSVQTRMKQGNKLPKSTIF